MDHEHREADHTTHEHGQNRLMIVMMLGCLIIGAFGVFYRSFYLDLAFVLTMGFCVGHHLLHRFRRKKHSDSST